MVKDIISELEIVQVELGVIRDSVEQAGSSDDLSRVDEAYMHIQEAIDILNQIEE